MQQTELIGRLPKDFTENLICSDQNININGIQLITRGQNDFKGDVLYFGDMSLLPVRLKQDQFLCFLGYGKRELPEFYHTCRNCNLVYLHPEADPFECYNLLQGLFLEDQDLTGKIRRIMFALLSNNGLQYLIDEASKTLGNPIFVVDTSYQYIARQTGELPADDSEYARIMRQEMEYNSILESGVNYIKNTQLDETVCKMNEPYCLYNDYLKKKTMISSVRIHGIEVAHVMMVEQNQPFSRNDFDCFQRLAHFVGQEMQKSAFYQTNKGQMYSYFLINLLNDPQPVQRVLQRRLQVLHYALLDKFIVAAIQPKKGIFTGQTFDVVTGQLRGILTGNIYALYDNCLVILFNRKKDASLGEYTEEVLERYATINFLDVGISNEFNDLTEIRQFYQQAVCAVQYGRRFPKQHNGGPLYFYREYAYVEMLDLCGKQANLMKFCHPRLLDLLAHDEESNSDLMNTLFEYLQHSANTRRTANALCIHKNTLLYRIDRIKSILGTDLSSGEDLFMFHLSFRILIYLDMFQPRHLQTEEKSYDKLKEAEKNECG